jgi:CRP-like cAMP-binding protein
MFDTLWKDLPSTVHQEFTEHSRLLQKKRGEFIYQEGDEPEGLYFIEKGLVGLLLIGSNSGKEHLLRFFRQGQFFGHRSLFAQEGYHGSTVALEPSEIRVVPKSVVLSALDRFPVMYQDLTYVLCKQLRRCEVQHVMILENQILSRTAQALIYLKDLHPDHMWTRQEIANFCASTTSTIIKAMAELESMGLIRQQGRQIEILDRESLIHLQDLENN